MRRTPMPDRRSPMGRSTELTRTAMKRKAARRPKLDPTLRDQVWMFAAGLCDMCGLPLPAIWECHHRRLRSQGGQDEPANLLALHDTCHSRAHHNRTWAQEHGYIVHYGDEPASRPVWRHTASWQLPTVRGWVPSEPPTTPYLPPTERTAVIKQFRKKPIVISAVQWTGDNEDTVQQLTGPHHFYAVDFEDRLKDPDITARVLDDLHSTWVGVKTGQWVIRGVRGELCPIDESVLAETYEQVPA